MKNLVKKLLGRWVERAPVRPPLRRAGLGLEALEDRWCPASYRWIGTNALANTWNNVNNWQIDSGGGNWGATGACPGGAMSDEVQFSLAAFNGAATVPANVNVAFNPLLKLEFTGWGNELAVNN